MATVDAFAENRAAAAFRRMARLLRHDAEIRAAQVTPAQLETLRASGATAIERIAAACSVYADRPCLGTRSLTKAGPTFTSVSYADLWTRVVRAACGLRAGGFVNTGQMVGIYGGASVDWIVVDLACLYLGAVCVPLQQTMSFEELAHIAREVELACVAAASSRLEVASRLVKQCPTIRGIVVIDGSPAALAPCAAELRTLNAVERGATAGERLPPSLPTDAGRLASVVYTSGSTGRPKGVMLTERRWADTLFDAVRNKPPPTVTVGYLPLTHMAGRIGIYGTMMAGGRTNLVPEEDATVLFDCIRATRPTSMTFVPRVSGMLHQQFLAQALRSNVDLALGYRHPQVAAVADALRDEWLGGRLCFVATGGAATAPEVAEFLSEGLGLHVVDAYGSTEVARIAVNGVVQPDVTYKLIDLPELGYTTRDRPYPRGELAVKSPRQTPGYFKNAEADAALRDDDGFMRTGDVVEERAPGRIAWIDRRHDLIKLANGECVNVSRLEALFATHSPYVEQAFVVGEPSSDYLLAVIVPSRSTVLEHEDVRGVESALRSGAVKKLLRAELDRIAAENRLRSFEVPRDFLLADEPFTSENGLLSDARKVRRPKLKERYGARLRQLYAEIAERQVRAQLEFGRLDGGSVADQVSAAVRAALGRDDLGGAGLGTSFPALGGDSLSASQLAATLRTLTGLSIDAHSLLDPSTDIASVVERSQRRASDPQVTFETVHGHDPRWIQPRDFDSAKFLPESLLARALELPLGGRPTRFLLTGGSGFLGHVLLAELVERVDGRDGWVACVVRGATEAAAYERLARRFRAAGAEWARAFEEWCASSRLRIHVGDVAKPRLGLAPSTYESLSETVDTVVHCAAFVNHLLKYRDLFAVNVGGTAAIMNFAVARQRKRIHFLSTTAVAARLLRDAPILETERADALWPRRSISSSSRTEYALGYATTKWASEIMLGNLHRDCGVPVTIYRSSMVLPHGTRCNVVNESDAFTRLLYGLAKTQVAPRSFYAADYRGPRHYDGLPVDLVARVVAESCRSADDGLGIYHVCNPNSHDGVSLDTIVDWVESAGYRIERLDHAAWYAEFVRRLARFSPEERKRSPEAIAFRWREPTQTGAGAIDLDTRLFRARLSALGVPQIPSISEAYVHHCLPGICGGPA